MPFVGPARKKDCLQQLVSIASPKKSCPPLSSPAVAAPPHWRRLGLCASQLQCCSSLTRPFFRREAAHLHLPQRAVGFSWCCAPPSMSLRHAPAPPVRGASPRYSASGLCSTPSSPHHAAAISGLAAPSQIHDSGHRLRFTSLSKDK
jgi:hypothetical protein